MSVLYRKYRPQTFGEIVGQPHVTRTLVAALASGRVAHAYLFSGPRGVGKTTAARLLAKAVNCEAHKRASPREAPKGRSGVARSQQNIPCNQCQSCTEITEGRCLDVIEIDAASHTGVDHVREHIVETVRFAPARCPRRVFIIDEVHMLSAASFNALLKTLEEPPAHTLFILATTEFHRVPETIRSRCQHFAFRRVALADLAARLQDLATAEQVTVDADVVQAIARTADGSVRDAESMFGQLLAFGGKHIASADAAFVLPHSSVERARSLADAIARRDLPAAIDEVHAAEEGGFDADAYLRDVITVLRDAILSSFSPSRGEGERERLSPSQRGGAGGGGTSVQGVGTSEKFAREVAALRAFSELLDRIGRSDRPFFNLEVAVLGLVASQPPAPSFQPQAPAGGKTSGVDRKTPDVEEPTAKVEGAVVTQPQRSHASPLRQGSVGQARLSSQGGSASRLKSQDSSQALTRIQSAWTSLPLKLADVNGSLPYLLEGGRPQRIADGALTIGFRYKLHAEKVRQPKVIDAIAHAVSEVAGIPLKVTTAVVRVEEFAALDAATRQPTGDAVADAALEVFGGQVVE